MSRVEIRTGNCQSSNNDDKVRSTVSYIVRKIPFPIIRKYINTYSLKGYWVCLSGSVGFGLKSMLPNSTDRYWISVYFVRFTNRV